MASVFERGGGKLLGRMYVDELCLLLNHVVNCSSYNRNELGLFIRL